MDSQKKSGDYLNNFIVLVELYNKCRIGYPIT